MVRSFYIVGRLPTVHCRHRSQSSNDREHVVHSHVSLMTPSSINGCWPKGGGWKRNRLVWLHTVHASQTWRVIQCLITGGRWAPMQRVRFREIAQSTITFAWTLTILSAFRCFAADTRVKASEVTWLGDKSSWLVRHDVIWLWRHYSAVCGRHAAVTS